MIDKIKKTSSPSPKASSNGNNNSQSRSALPNRQQQQSSSRMDKSLDDNSNSGNGLVKNKKLLNGKTTENGDQDPYKRARSISSSSSSSHSSSLKIRKLRSINGDSTEGEGASDLNDHHLHHQTCSKRSPQREALATAAVAATSSHSSSSRRPKQSEASDSTSTNGKSTSRKRSREKANMNVLHNGNEVSLASFNSSKHHRSKHMSARPSSPRHSKKHCNSSRLNSSFSHHNNTPPSTSDATATIEQLLKPKVKVDFKIPKLKNRMEQQPPQPKDDVNGEQLTNGENYQESLPSTSFSFNGNEYLDSQIQAKTNSKSNSASTSVSTSSEFNETSFAKLKTNAKSFDESFSSLSTSMAMEETLESEEETIIKDKKKKSKRDKKSETKKRSRSSKGNGLSKLKRINNLCKAECELLGIFDTSVPSQIRPSFRRDLQTSLTRSFNVYNARLPPQAARRSARRLSSNSSSSNSASEHYLDLYKPEVNKTISKLVPSDYFAAKHEQRCGQECRFIVSTSLDELQLAFEQGLAECELRMAQHEYELEIAKPALEGKGFRKELSKFCLTSHELPKPNLKKQALERRSKIGGLATQQKAVDKIRAMEFKMFSNSLDAFTFMDHQQYNVRSGRGGNGASSSSGANYKDANYKFILDPPKSTPLAQFEEPQIVVPSTPTKEETPNLQPKKRGRKRQSPVPKKAKVDMSQAAGPVKTTSMTSDATPKDNVFTGAFGKFMAVMLDDADSEEIGFLTDIIRLKDQKLTIVEDVNKFLSNSQASITPSSSSPSKSTGRLSSPTRSLRLSPSKYSSGNQNSSSIQSHSNNKKGREVVDDIDDVDTPSSLPPGEDFEDLSNQSPKRRTLERRCLKGRRSSSRANSSENLFNEIVQTSTFMTRQQIQSLADVCGSPNGTKKSSSASLPPKNSSEVGTNIEPLFASIEDVYQHHVDQLKTSIKNDCNLLENFSALEQNWGFQFQKTPEEQEAGVSTWQLMTQYRAFANKLSREQQSQLQQDSNRKTNKKQQQLLTKKQRKWAADMSFAFEKDEDDDEDDQTMAEVEMSKISNRSFEQILLKEMAPKPLKKSQGDDEFSKAKLAQSCYLDSSGESRQGTKARRSKRTPKTNRFYENADYECSNSNATRKNMADVNTSISGFDWNNMDMDTSLTEFFWCEDEDKDEQENSMDETDVKNNGNLTTTLTPSFDVDSNLVLSKTPDEANTSIMSSSSRSRTSRSRFCSNSPSVSPAALTNGKAVLNNMVAQLMASTISNNDQEIEVTQEDDNEMTVNNTNNEDDEDEITKLLSFFQRATNEAIEQNVNTLTHVRSLMSDEIRLQDLRRKLDKINYELVVDHSRYILNPAAVNNSQRAMLEEKIERRDSMAREMSDLFYRLVGQASYNYDLYFRLPTSSVTPFKVFPLCIQPSPSSSSRPEEADDKN